MVHTPIDTWHSTLDAQNSTLDTQCSPNGSLWSGKQTRMLTLNAQCSTLDSQQLNASLMLTLDPNPPCLSRVQERAYWCNDGRRSSKAPDNWGGYSPQENVLLPVEVNNEYAITDLASLMVRNSVDEEVPAHVVDTIPLRMNLSNGRDECTEEAVQCEEGGL